MENLYFYTKFDTPCRPQLGDVVALPPITITQHACITTLDILSRLDTCHAPDADMADEREAERPTTLLKDERRL